MCSFLVRLQAPHYNTPAHLAPVQDRQNLGVVSGRKAGKISRPSKTDTSMQRVRRETQLSRAVTSMQS